MQPKIRFGIIGCSSIAERITIPAILESKDAHLQKIGSRSALKAKKFAKKFSCGSYGDYEGVLEDSNVDAVYISLPIALQADMIIRSAKAGKNIICEKSATTSFAIANKIIKTCKNNQVRILEAFSFRFHPQHNKVSSMIDKKPLGKPYAFISKFLIPMEKSKDNFRFNKGLGGGALNDLGCYIICASRVLFHDNPITVNCRLLSDKRYGVDTYGTISLGFPHNRQAFGIFGYDNNFQSNYEIVCSNGLVFSRLAYNIRKKERAIIDIHTINKTKIVSLQSANQSRLMIDKFCAELRGKIRSSDTFEGDLLIQAKIMEASRISSKEERLVNMKGFK